MTEQSPYGATAVAEPPAPELPESFDDGEAPDNRRRFILLGAILGAVLLLVAAYFLLFKGGSSAPVDGGVVPSAPAAGAAPVSVPGQPAPKVVMPKHYKGHVGRDPFKPLFVAAPPSDGTSAASDSGSSATTGSGSSSTTTTTTSTTPTDTSTVPTGGTSTSTTGSTSTNGSKSGSGTGKATSPRFAPVWIELVSVKGTKSASFVVAYSDGKTTKMVGFDKVTAPTKSLRTKFARVFALLSIHDRGVTVQFGDGTPFDLKRGFKNRHYVG